MGDNNTMILNMGPQHPSTHGVLRVILELDGEVVVKATPDIGFLHRGLEKLAESKTYHQCIPLTDPLDYVAGMSNNLAYVLAVEKLLGLEVPPRAQAIRVLLCELQRISSHLLWLGTHAHDIGAMTPLFYAMRERDEILFLFERVCGSRLTPLLLPGRRAIDLEVPVVGMPIRVIRTYDSRDKRVGDFGVGWTLSLMDMRLQENGAQGMDWQGSILSNGFTYCIQPTRGHIVTITLPDNQIYKFMASVPPPGCWSFAPPQVVNVVYQPLPGTNATLTQLDFPDPALVEGTFPGPLRLLDQNTYIAYDPNRYKLTLQDGRSFVISQQDGLQTITDLNGNVLTFTQNGISHSAGKSLTFTRDTDGRITSIKDPAGNSQTYEYDSAGDLTKFTDREANKTTFTYDAAHYLLDIHGILSRENNVTAAVISQWRDRLLQAGLASLKADHRDSGDEEIRQLHAKVGQLTMENQLLNQKIDRMESGHPLAYRRSKR